jgi:hypothetical protein
MTEQQIKDVLDAIWAYVLKVLEYFKIDIFE